jgi:hypothetical protein
VVAASTTEGIDKAAHESPTWDFEKVSGVMLVFNVATCQTSHEKNAQEIVETTDQICAIDIQESFGFLDELTNKSLSLKSTASAYSMRRPADDSAKPMTQRSQR